MFFSNNTVAQINSELRARMNNPDCFQKSNNQPTQLNKICMKPFARSSLIALALAGIFGLQISSSAFAETSDTPVKKHKRELANPQTYVLKQKQGQPDNKASEAALLEQKKNAYDKLGNSVKALTKALKRESEKAEVDNSETFAKVEANTKEADQIAKSGDYDKAHETLENGYYMLTDQIVKLENLKGQGLGERTDMALEAKPRGAPTDPRSFVEHELKTSKALLDALKHQDEDKLGGKSDEIASIKATAAEAEAELQAGNIDRAKELIHDANSRTKIAIASLQKKPGMKPGSIADEASHHAEDIASAQESYDKRRTAVEALLEAGQRVDEEHNTHHNEFARAESMLNEANQLASANNFTEGQALLDRTYLLLKDTMRKMLSLKEEKKPVVKRQAPKPPKKPVKVRTDAQQ